jgi:transposase-like protein
MTDVRICKRCDEQKPIGLFKEYAPGKHRYTCKACQETDQRKYQKRYDEKKRLKKIYEGAPSMRQEIDALKAQMQTLLAMLDSHGYNTTET